jgi:hypothetical protein
MICGRWFQPHVRIGDRQRACSKSDCQSARRKKKQSAWRASNPDYFTARRILERAKPDPKGDVVVPPSPPRMPRPLDRLPWDVAQSQFGVQGSEFLGAFGRVLVRSAQSQMRPEAADTS